jgi:hypothetical protein
MTIDINNIRECGAYLILEGNTVGLTFSTIYKDCEEYSEVSDLSKDLNNLIKANLIQKQGNEYWDIKATVTEPSVVKKTKSLRREKADIDYLAGTDNFAATIEEEDLPGTRLDSSTSQQDSTAVAMFKPYLTYKEPAIDIDSELAFELAAVGQKKKGTLNRTKIQLKLALTVYFNKDETFTLPELRRRTGVAYQSCYGFLVKMLNFGYVVHEGKGYRWSGEYKYPFPTVKPGDDAWATVKIIKVVPPVILTGKPVLLSSSEPLLKVTKTVLPILEPKPTTARVVEAPDSILSGLDAVIARYERELASLLFARTNLLTSLA